MNAITIFPELVEYAPDCAEDDMGAIRRELTRRLRAVRDEEEIDYSYADIYLDAVEDCVKQLRARVDERRQHRCKYNEQDLCDVCGRDGRS